MARPGPRNALTDVAGLSVGCAEDRAAFTGVTVIVPVQRAVCGVDVRGGGPGTRETDALAPENLVDAVDALVLAGGSVYGLAAADGVAAAMGAQGKGFGLSDLPGVPKSPVIPAAILYDLANGGDKGWRDAPPYSALGRAAYAGRGDDVPLGNAGAGYGALAGALKGGQGSASIVTADGFTVAALACVNCWGSVTMPNGHAFWAHPFEIDGEFGGVKPDANAAAFDAEDWSGAKFNPQPRANTTLAVVAVDAVLTPAEAKRVAQMASAGLARAIRPVFAPFDGDVVFALATGARAAPEPRALAVARFGALAADCLARAVARGVYAAAALGGAPGLARSPMYLIVWRYAVAPAQAAAFRAAYGPDGDWARLFKRGAGFAGVELYSDDAAGIFLTLDRWASAADFAAFQAAHGADYAALDARLAGLSQGQTRVGAFTET